MKKAAASIMIIVIAAVLALPCFAAGNAVVGLTLECPDDLFVGGQTSVRISVGKPDVSLQAIEFALEYDPDYVTPLVTENGGDDMLALAKTIPSGWEQMSSLNAEENKYYLHFAIQTENGVPITMNNQLVVEIRFQVKTAGSVTFKSESRDIVAVSVSDPFKALGGTGGSVTAFASSDTEKLSVLLSGEDSAVKGGNYALDISVTNLSDPTGIIAMQFDLEYDKTAFKPVINSNANGEMDVFMVETPANSWEQMCSLNEASGKYTLRFAANGAGDKKDELLMHGESIKLRIEFQTIGDEGRPASFNVAKSSVTGLNALTGMITGNGSTLSVSIEDRTANIDDPNGKYTLKNGCIVGVAEKTDVAEFLFEIGGIRMTDQSGKEVSKGYVCTGYKVFISGKEYSVSVRGDCSGNGVVDAPDYAMTKRTVLGTFEPNEPQLYAMCLSGTDDPGAFDYVMIKRHVLGTYNINTTEYN